MERRAIPFKDAKTKANPRRPEARRAYVKRGDRIRCGTLPGLLVNGGKTVRPEIKELIDEALAKKHLS